MRRLTFFPVPYPDECYYSIFCRYFARNGDYSNKRMIRELFGEQQSLAAFVFLPRRLDLVETWLDTDCGITRESLACQNSAYPYFSISFPERMFQRMERMIETGKADRNMERMAIQKCSRSCWPEYLRYCPNCVLEDIETYGETYWHRLPQLPGIKYCPKHDTLIRDSRVRLRDTTTAFFPASFAVKTTMEEKEDDFHDPYKERYLRIARDTEWILSHGVRFKGCRQLVLKYKEILMERGFTTAQGIIYRDRFEKSFIEYHSKEFLNQLFPNGEHSLYWLQFVVECTAEHLRSIHHILMMEYLSGTALDFYQAAPDNEPYGKGPWPCVNKICDHYGKDGAQKISVEYVNGQTIGYFWCPACGMRYRRSQPNRVFEEYAPYVTILDRGKLWYDTLREYAETQKLGLKEIASRMKCTAYIVRTYGKKMGLPSSIITQWEPKPVGNCRHPLRNPSQYYRRTVQEVLKTHPELTVTELQAIVPGAYSWFHKNDFQWLKERLVTEQEKQYWIEWEMQQLDALKKAYEIIRQTGNPDRRVTIGWLCTIAGLRDNEIRGRLHRFSSIRAFLNEVVEPKEVWIRRRVTAIAAEKALIGRPLTLADVKNEMSLKPNTYKKYALYLKELIEQLNRPSFGI